MVSSNGKGQGNPAQIALIGCEFPGHCCTDSRMVNRNGFSMQPALELVKAFPQIMQNPRRPPFLFRPEVRREAGGLV